MIDASRLGESVPLKGMWRFHAGDNPQWADPNFDDSSWRLITTEKSSRQQGVDGLRGYLWFRVKVSVPEHHGPLLLFTEEIGPSELYVDGQKVDTVGRFPPDTQIVFPGPRTRAIPSTGSVHSIAIRFWLPSVGTFDGVEDGFTIATKEGAQRRSDLFFTSTLTRRIPVLITDTLQILLCVGLLFLFYLDRDHAEYLFLAISVGASALNGAFETIYSVMPNPIVLTGYLSLSLSALAAMAMLEFVFRFIREPMPIWLRIYQLTIPLITLAQTAFWAGWVSDVVLNGVLAIYLVPYWFLTPGVVIWRFFKGNKEAGWLAMPLFLLTLNDMQGPFAWLLFWAHLRSNSDRFVHDFKLGLFSIDTSSVMAFFFVLSIGALILYRFQKTLTEQARASAELEAARGMQEAMVPASVEADGFRIETAYYPAQEVGGDFYQLYPRFDGSLLVVIGDVSGKGLKSAMLVSMILGMFRSAVEETRSPAQILTHVNRLLIGHTDGKFATCCSALLFSDGRAIIANAGHMSPYCEGKEVEIPGGLPLGIDPLAQYEEVQHRACKRWVFLSDGVVEARNSSGELYGFERTRAISIQPAHKIAEAAQHFGQEDDITVLGIQTELAIETTALPA